MIRMHTKSKVFIDTNIFVALRDKSDPTHQRAVKILTSFIDKDSHFYTSSDVIGETLTVLSRKLGKNQAKIFAKEIPDIAIEIFIDDSLHKKARTLFSSIQSKNISFIDCSSVIAMKENNIPFAFTFDKHFKTLGVKLCA